MKIAICGSMAFAKEMVKVANKLKNNNHETILPHNAKKYADGTLKGETNHESTKNKIDNDLIRDYFNKIKNADSVLIANFDKNGIQNYIGGNSFLEMGFAHVLDKKVFLLNPIPQIAYSDEIIGLQPIILNGNLNKIE